MATIIRSDAFLGGRLSYTPLNARLVQIFGASPIGWFCPGPPTFRTVDTVWDDHVAENVSWVSLGGELNGARIADPFGAMPTVDIAGAGQRIVSGLTLPESYTIVISAMMLTSNVGKALIGGPSNATPRLFFGTNGGGVLTLSHEGGSTSLVGHSAPGAIALGTPFVAFASYDQPTKTGRVGLNSTTGASATFATDKPAAAGVCLGGFVNVTSNAAAVRFGDAFFFPTDLLSDARARVMRWVAARAAVTLTA